MKLKIFNGRTDFYQWDSNQKLIIDDPYVSELHFTNKKLEEAIVVPCYEKDGLKLCDIPNVFLEESGFSTVYAFTYENGNYTKMAFKFNVIARPKPNDYVIEEEDINRWGELDNKINQTKDELENEINSNKEELDSKINSTKDELNNLEKDVADLQDDKAEKNHTHQYSMIAGLQSELNKKANNEHTHSTSDIHNLDTMLNNIRDNIDGKASINHKHEISDVNMLQYRLDTKASISHDHDMVYYKQSEIHNLLNDKANTTHYHDNRYYPKTEIDKKLENVTINDEQIANAVEEYLNENPIEGGGVQPLVGTITSNGQNEYKCSLTYDEIKNAYNEKRQVVIYDGQWRYDLVHCNYTWARFNCVDEYSKYGFEISSSLVRRNSYIIQDQNPSGLRTNSSSIVGAINELKDNIDDNNTKTNKLETQIDKVNDKIVNAEWIAKPTYKKEMGDPIVGMTLFFNSDYSDCSSEFAKRLINGKTYIVSWNGVEYNTRVVNISDETNTIIVFGNLGGTFNGTTVEGYEDTGEPFLYMYMENVANRFMKITEDAENVVFEIYECEEVNNPIPTKYLPSHLQFGGDEYTTDEFVLDESSSDYETVTVEDAIGVKITDFVPTIEQLIGGTVGFYNNDVYFEEPIIEEHIQDMREQGVPMLMVGDGLLIVYEDNAMMGVSVTKGIWFMVTDYFHISKLKLTEPITVGEIKKLDSKYLPTFGSTEIENVLVEEGTYELNGEEMGMQTINFVDVPKRTNDTFIVSWNGTEYEYHTLTTLQYNENTTWHIFGNIGVMNETLGTNYPITNEPFIGAYVEFSFGYAPNIVIVPLDGSTSANISVYQAKENNLLIQSPNGKVFKLVVDDDGNLSTVAI